MTNSELLLAGVKLMVCGMGIVFVFLVLMIGAMNLLRVALAPFAHALDGKTAGPAKKNDDLALVAAAVAAADMERNRK